MRWKKSCEAVRGGRRRRSSKKKKKRKWVEERGQKRGRSHRK